MVEKGVRAAEVHLEPLSSPLGPSNSDPTCVTHKEKQLVAIFITSAFNGSPTTLVVFFK